MLKSDCVHLLFQDDVGQNFFLCCFLVLVISWMRTTFGTVALLLSDIRQLYQTHKIETKTVRCNIMEWL